MKPFFIGLFLIFNVFDPAFSMASVNIRDVRVSNQDELELVFDGDIKEKQIQTEYLRDIIQLTVRGSSIYPAKIVSVPQGAVKKIFAYQYTPKLVRIRLTVDESADFYRDRVSLQAKGRRLVIRVKPQKALQDSLQMISAQSQKSPQEQKPASHELAAEDTRLLKNILGEDKKKTEITRTIGKNVSSPDPIKMMGWLMLLTGLVLVSGLVFLKRRGRRQQGSKKGILGFLSAKTGTPAIEFVTTKAIGPKKNITVVRVDGRTLVLGVSAESINLIADLGSGSASGGNSAQLERFEDLLEDAPVPSEAAAPQPAPVQDRRVGIREQIRRRVEGLKTL